MERKRRLEQRAYSFDDLMPGDWFATPDLVVEESQSTASPSCPAISS